VAFRRHEYAAAPSASRRMSLLGQRRSVTCYSCLAAAATVGQSSLSFLCFFNPSSPPPAPARLPVDHPVASTRAPSPRVCKARLGQGAGRRPLPASLQKPYIPLPRSTNTADCCHRSRRHEEKGKDECSATTAGRVRRAA
jgi:hypothetical protein